MLQRVRQMRFESLLDRHDRSEMSPIEAADMLGITERKFRRWRDRWWDEVPAGLLDRGIGEPSSWRAAVEKILRMLGLYQDLFSDAQDGGAMVAKEPAREA